KYVVGGSRRGPVGAFDQDLRLHLVGIARVDDVLRGGRNQDFTIGDQQFFRVRALSALEAVDGAFLLAIFPQRGNVHAFAVVQAAIPFADADHLVSRLMHEDRGVGADVAEALDDHASVFARHVVLLDGFVADDHHAAAGGFT